MATGMFTKDNQPEKRGKRGRTKRTLMLEALQATIKDEFDDHYSEPEEAEAAFYRLMVARSLNVADKASGMLTKEILDRMCPTDKATLPKYEFEFREGGTPVEKINDITAAVSQGIIPPDVGNMMANMVATAVKVEETTEILESRATLVDLLGEIDKD